MIFFGCENILTHFYILLNIKHKQEMRELAKLRGEKLQS